MLDALLVAAALAATPVAAPKKPAAAPPAEKQKPEDEESRFKTCVKKLELAQKLKLIHDVGWQEGEDPRVLVGPTFFDVAIDVKEGVADTVNCVLTGGRSDVRLSFDLLDWRTGKAIGRYRFGRVEMK